MPYLRPLSRLPCDLCEIRKTKKVYRILTNKKNITEHKLAFHGKKRRIKEGSRYLLCDKCEASAEWHGLTLEFIKEGLTKEELSIREKKWEHKEFKRAIL